MRSYGAETPSICTTSPILEGELIHTLSANSRRWQWWIVYDTSMANVVRGHCWYHSDFHTVIPRESKLGEALNQSHLLVCRVTPTVQVLRPQPLTSTSTYAERGYASHPSLFRVFIH